MHHVLKSHPDCSSRTVTRIDADIIRASEGRLSVHYRTAGIPVVPLPPLETLSETMRGDELWRHTCFEVFVRPAGCEAYVEFNFSPALQWAAYALDGYRHNRCNLDTAPPAIRTLTGDGDLMLDAELQLEFCAESDWLVGLSAVIEEEDGTISYWALAHAPGKPDFHHAGAFALQLPGTP